MEWTKFNTHGESSNHAFEVMCNILLKHGVKGIPRRTEIFFFCKWKRRRWWTRILWGFKIRRCHWSSGEVVS